MPNARLCLPSFLLPLGATVEEEEEGLDLLATLGISASVEVAVQGAQRIEKFRV